MAQGQRDGLAHRMERLVGEPPSFPRDEIKLERDEGLRPPGRLPLKVLCRLEGAAPLCPRQKGPRQACGLRKKGILPLKGAPFEPNALLLEISI